MWVKFNRPWGEFLARGLAKPGVAIMVDGYPCLIGHVNEVGGLESECPSFIPEQIVQSYRQLISWPPEAAQPRTFEGNCLGNHPACR
jgi:hypothetical protein